MIVFVEVNNESPTWALRDVDLVFSYKSGKATIVGVRQVAL